MIENDPVLTAEEIAEDLQQSKATVYRLMRGLVKGVTPLPCIPVGRKKVTLRSVLEDWKRRNLSGGIISNDSETDTG